MQKASLQSSIFVDVCDHGHYTVYNHAFNKNYCFADSELIRENRKFEALENFPLYGITIVGKKIKIIWRK